MRLNKTILALGATVALATFGTAGAAADIAHAAATKATCDALMKQADTALAAHKTDAKAKSAQEHRAAGDKECKAGNYAKGTEQLRMALTDVGMKPID